MYPYSYSYSYSSSRLFDFSSWQFVVGLIFALAVTVLLFCSILSKSKEGTFTGFKKVVRDFFNLKYLILERIAKFLYVLFTLCTIFTGFFLLFGKTFLIGFIMMVFGPIVLRLSYELFMMIILLVKNTMEINAKIKDETGVSLTQFEGPSLNNAFEERVPSSVVPQVNPGKRCPLCGKELQEDAVFCDACGTRIQ